MQQQYKTLKQAREELARYEMNITKTAHADELRVTFKPCVPGYETAERREAVAYYCDDYDDAVATGKAMHMQHSAVVHRAAQAVRDLLK
jgi:hypothetical protein